MHAEVISVGDELTSGQRLNTNSQWLSQKLAELGVATHYHTTVGDDIEANAKVFRQAWERVRLVICTGGLGPTADDLTRDALAVATGTELVLDEAALAQIRALFARRKREMPERNVVQAMFPRGARIIPNPHGSAPGIDMDIPREGQEPARVFAVPGVPVEMREMWEHTVAPAILAMLGDQRRIIRVRTIRCFGVGESDLEAMLPDLIRRGRQPTVGITVSKATISLRIVAEASDDASCQQQIDDTVRVIHQCLGRLVFGEESDELSDALVHLAAIRQQTIATAEAGSGGLLAHWLSVSDRQQRWYRGGIVRRNNQCPTAERTGEFAAEARRQLQADYGLALSDFPAAPATGQVPGDFHVAYADANGVSIGSYPFAGHPDILVARAAKMALNFLRLAWLVAD